MEAIRSGKIHCRAYTKEKFHAKAYITHGKASVIGSSALVGSSNFTLPGLTNNVELNIQIRREVEILQAWYERYWDQAEDITPDILQIIERQILEYCEEFKGVTDIEEVWYATENFIPEEWTKGKDSFEFDDIFHQCGFTFCDRTEIQEFLNDDLERPTVKGTYINGKSIKYDLHQIGCNFHKIYLPPLKRNQVFVYHGFIDIFEMDYVLNTDDDFCSDKLIFEFVDCGEYGYLLTEIKYNGKQMKRYFGRTQIEVKSGRHSHTLFDSLRIFDFVRPRNFLDVKFKKRRG